VILLSAWRPRVPLRSIDLRWVGPSGISESGVSVARGACARPPMTESGEKLTVWTARGVATRPAAVQGDGRAERSGWYSNNNLPVGGSLMVLAKQPGRPWWGIAGPGASNRQAPPETSGASASSVRRDGMNLLGLYGQGTFSAGRGATATRDADRRDAGRRPVARRSGSGSGSSLALATTQSGRKLLVVQQQSSGGKTRRPPTSPC
jgi:hypothetical protein